MNIRLSYFRAVLYRRIVKPLLFLFQPETAHHIVFGMLGVMDKLPGLLRLLSGTKAFKMEEAVTVAGIRFPNRVGLAAGFDKDARRFRQFGAIGFGFVEIGTVTPFSQPGNPKPRLFRLPLDNALINRMGFNNQGAEAAAKRLRKSHAGVIIGGNIGKNKATPNEAAADDYRKCFVPLFEHVDYFVVNVSSPNTPGLRELQEKGPLKEILTGLRSLNVQLAEVHGTNVRPIFLKIAPDLEKGQLDDIVEVVTESGCAGVIATNTTVSRQGLKTSGQTVESCGTGGLSGKPLKERSTEVIRYLKEKSKGSFVIIGVGGIHNAADAMEKLEAGASLVQLYTGFVYEGPGLVSSIRKAVLRKYHSS